MSLPETIATEIVSGYASLQQYGGFTTESANQLGQYVGSNIRAPSTYVLHGEHELTKDFDTSLQRVLSYRSDMREALAPLVTADPPEYETFAYYVETKNPKYLDQLSEAAQRYGLAEKNTLGVVVPQDATELHLRVVNSLGVYGNVTKQLIRSVDHPFIVLAVLRSYNDAEREMLYAFDALADYYVRKSTEK